MQFSIIIPVYNVEKYLEHCLYSVLNQTFTDFEVICVNDGSTDGSLAVLHDCEQKFLSADFPFSIINQENAGLSDARNTAIRAAKGDYIFLLDSDDWIAENTLEILNKNIDNQDFIVFNGERFFEDGRTEKPDKGILETKLTGWEYYNKYALKSRKFHFVCAVLRLYRREFLIENELFFKKGIYHEDNLFTPLCCYYAENVKVIPDILYIYRIRGGSITTQSWYSYKRMSDFILIDNLLADFADKKAHKIHKVLSLSILNSIFETFFNTIKNAKKEDLEKLYSECNWLLFNKLSKKNDIKILYSLLRNKKYSLFKLFYKLDFYQWRKIKRKIAEKCNRR